MSDILITVTRGPLVENIHRGDMVVVNRLGKIIAKAGYPYKVTYMRSSAKPIQASAVIESGAADRFGIEERELAVMCASHYAEDFHVQAVESIIQKLELDESRLLCGAAYSLNEKVTSKLIQEGKGKRKIYNNCSGKHAGMLALALHKGFDLNTYIEPDNPVQQLMLDTVAEYTNMDKSDIQLGIDGCGVPVFGMPIYNMAISYAKLSDYNAFTGKRKEAAAKIVNAMTGYPEMISGTYGFCSALIKITKGRIFGKLGADGVYCLGVRGKGIGLALKIEDGNAKALSCAVIEALKQLGELNDMEISMLKDFYIRKIVNTLGDKVGEMKPDFKLTFA